MTFWVQVPNRWGPKQIVRSALEAAGCTVEEYRVIGRAEVWLKVTRPNSTKPGRRID